MTFQFYFQVSGINYDDDEPRKNKEKYIEKEGEIKSYFQVSGVLLIAPTANSLESRRKEFSQNMKEVRILFSEYELI